MHSKLNKMKHDKEEPVEPKDELSPHVAPPAKPKEPIPSPAPVVEEKPVVKPAKPDIYPELEAIRFRLGQRRLTLFAGATSTGPYNTTDLADAEWLLVELDHALGHDECLTPSERQELGELTNARVLSQSDQEVLDRITSKHGDLTPEELVERDYLTMKQDKALTTVQQSRFKELSEKAQRTHKHSLLR